MITVSIIAHIVRLYCLKDTYKYFFVKDYLIKFLFPAVLITAFTFVSMWMIRGLIDNGILRLLIIFLSTTILQITLSYLFIVNKNERLLINNLISKSIKKTI